MKRSILLLLLSCVVFSSFAQKKKIEIKQTDIMKGDKEVRKLYGNVIFKHEDVFMYCDSALSYSRDNRFEAYGHVRIVNKDVTIYGDTLYYSSVSSLASLRGNIRMIHGKMNLTTHYLDYDVNENLGYYHGGGKIIDETNILKSNIGRYYVNSRMLFFKKDVELVNPNYVITTDTLKYQTSSNVAYFLGPSKITSDQNLLYTKNGWYNTQTDQAQFYKESYLNRDSKFIYGNDIFYNRKTDVGVVRGDVVVSDTAQQISIYSQYGYYDGGKRTVFLTDSALATKAFNKDTLYLHADSLYFMQLTDTINGDSVNYEVIKAYNKTRFFKSDLQGVCDSLVYHAKDSMIYLFGRPIIWSEENQMTGVDIRLKLADNNKRLDKLIVESQAFVVSQSDNDKFDQMKGKSLVGYFKNNELYKVDIFQNSETLYYMKDKGEILGVNKAICNDISAYLKNGKIDQIVFKTKPEGTFSPIEQFSAKQAKIDNFQWFDNVRPLNPLDVYNWR